MVPEFFEAIFGGKLSGTAVPDEKKGERLCH